MFSVNLLPEPSITTGTNDLDAAWGILTGFDLAGRDPPVNPISTASASTRFTGALENSFRMKSYRKENVYIHFIRSFRYLWTLTRWLRYKFWRRTGVPSRVVYAGQRAWRFLLGLTNDPRPNHRHEFLLTRYWRSVKGQMLAEVAQSPRNSGILKEAIGLWLRLLILSWYRRILFPLVHLKNVLNNNKSTMNNYTKLH